MLSVRHTGGQDRGGRKVARRSAVLRCAVSASCVTLVVSGCGATSLEKKAEAVNKQVRVYSSNRAAATTTLAKLAVPAEFQRVADCHAPVAETYSECFRRRHSLVLDTTVMSRLVSSFGVTTQASAVHCTPVRRSRTARLTLVACSAVSTVGADRLLFDVTSLVVTTQTSALSSSRGVRGVPGGSVVKVTDVGVLQPNT
jgi:hypothetical protein